MTESEKKEDKMVKRLLERDPSTMVEILKYNEEDFHKLIASLEELANSLQPEHVGEPFNNG